MITSKSSRRILQHIFIIINNFVLFGVKALKSNYLKKFKS